jgi:hypothetical protein
MAPERAPFIQSPPPPADSSFDSLETLSNFYFHLMNFLIQHNRINEKCIKSSTAIFYSIRLPIINSTKE